MSFSVNLSEKARSLKPSSTLAVTARAQELKKAGVDVVSMAAGEPDFDTPQHIKDAAIAALNAGKTKYTAVQGIAELRDVISAKLERENGLKYSPDHITVSTGGKQSLFNAFLAFLDPGDEVIIPAPFWVSYPEMIAFAGGVPVFVDTLAENGYALDPEDLAKAVTGRTKAIMLNSPANPTGVVYSEDIIRRVVEIAVQHGLLIVTDEMYEHIIYGDKHVSAARFDLDHVLTINGASKAYSMTGWRIGYAAGPAALIKAMNAIQGQSTSNPNTIAQWAAAAAIADSYAYIAMARAKFQERRDRIVAGLNDMGLKTPLPGGAFYVMADTTPIHKDEMEAARVILDQAKVAVVPGTDFRAPGRVRLSYATSMEQIEEALSRIGKLL
jgi:aspartate aminotransferase